MVFKDRRSLDGDHVRSSHPLGGSLLSPHPSLGRPSVEVCRTRLEPSPTDTLGSETLLEGTSVSTGPGGPPESPEDPSTRGTRRPLWGE